MELRHIRSFLVLSEKLHFGKAAESLFIVQPALTKQIKELEDHLGVKLFYRTKRMVALTPEGEYFKSQADQIMNMADVLKKEIRSIGDGTKGEIKIGYVGSCIHTFLPGFLDLIATKYPDIHWYLNEMTTEVQEKEIREGTLDLAFLRNPLFNSDISGKVVFSEPFAVVIPKNHPCSEITDKELHLLQNEKFILPTPNDGKTYHHVQLSIFENAGFAPRIAHESVHGHTVLKMVEHNFGISVLPLSFQQFAGDLVKFIVLENIPQKSEISMIWKIGNRNPCLKKILEIIEQGN